MIFDTLSRWHPRDLFISSLIGAGFITAVGLDRAAGEIIAGNETVEPTRGSRTARDIEWRTGADLRQQLRTPTQINWSGKPLRNALDGLAENQRVAIFLDRRVDPDQAVEFASGEGTLEAALARLTEQLQLTYYPVGNLIFVAKPEDLDAVVTELELRKEQLNGPLRSQRPQWLQSIELNWEPLSEPREILTQLSQEMESPLSGIEHVPHDLWPSRQWPELSRLEAVALLLGGFDLGVDLAADGTATIGPLNHQTRIDRAYRIPTNRAINVVDLQGQFPAAEIVEQGNRLKVAASLLTHRFIDQRISGETTVAGMPPRNGSSQAGSTEQKVYTLRDTTTSAGNVMATIARQLKVELRTEGAAAEKLKAQITIDVTDVDIDELLHTVLDPLQLNYQLTDRQLVIRPK